MYPSISVLYLLSKHYNQDNVDCNTWEKRVGNWGSVLFMIKSDFYPILFIAANPYYLKS